MLICSGIRSVWVVRGTRNLLRITFKVGINDERHSQLFFNILEFHSFLFIGEDYLLSPLLVAKWHVLIQTTLSGKGVKTIVAKVLCTFVSSPMAHQSTEVSNQAVMTLLAILDQQQIYMLVFDVSCDA